MKDLKDILATGAVIGAVVTLGVFLWLNAVVGDLRQEMALKPSYEPHIMACGTDPCVDIETAPAYTLDLDAAVASGALTIDN